MALAKQTDRVQVLHAYEDEEKNKEVGDAYRKNFAENGYNPGNITYAGVHHQGGSPIYHTLSSRINEGG
eukprot:CAMPEP_0197555806 /NCGR_PEP_ID=MMETSP1320-20131121/13969_1 /TAXON_ID=91990 /ORGANISM="Bolidomonas sp., Strain RCC2347" /LENGTH=68 /DNA_ID=CAMNT_0043116853 /DNA_START=27 /DNA_END=230 /DNA_ORIENTATION=+